MVIDPRTESNYLENALCCYNINIRESISESTDTRDLVKVFRIVGQQENKSTLLVII